MNMEQAMLILRALLTLLGILVVVFVQPMIEPTIEMLKAKKEEIDATLTAQQREDFEAFVLTMVESAEQAMKSSSGQEKKKEVMKKIAKKLSDFTKLTISVKEIDDLVESFVYGMNAAKGK